MIDTVMNDRFQVDERLARQGAVEIYEGLDLVQGEPVWIKRFGSPVDQDLDFIENWRAQLLSVQAVDDGHLPEIYDFGRSREGDLYQVEERPHGVTLRRFSATRAPMSVGASVALVAAAARAVGAAHREGIAHGGLTPENIYIEEEAVSRREAFVSGWELGEMIISLRNAGEPIPERMSRYLAPEQRSLPAPPATPAIDVYALGAMLYELLTGSLPTAKSTDGPFAEPPPPRRFNPEIPMAVEREVLRALSYEAAARHPNSYAFSQALTSALNAPNPAVTTPLPLVEERIERVMVERPGWLPVAAMLAALLICGLLFLLLWSNRGGTELAVAPGTEEPETVPNLVGPPYMRYNDAVALAWNEGFAVNIVGFVEDENLPAGVVVAQCPPAGASPDAVAECPSLGILGVPPSDDTILVEVSSLPEPVVLRVVPDLFGQPEPEARAILEAGDLRLGTRREAYDQLMPAGRIIEQNPRRGLGILPGTPVDIIVSAGPPPTGEMGLVNPTPATGVIPPPAVEPTPAPAEYPPPDTGVALPTESAEALSTPFPTDTEPPLTAVSPTVEEPTTVLLEDDFEAGNTVGWVVAESEGQSSTIEDGVFAVAVTEPELFWKSEAGRLFSDFTYQAEVTLGEDSLDQEGGAGLVFRIQDDQHFYFFEINGQGQYRLRARDEDNWVTLLDWDSSPEIRPAGLANILQVTAEGERLTLFINGSQIAVLDTPSEVTYLEGDIGLAVESATSPISATFDNVLVTR
ncbi:MAG: PASTA domain-containing protein [Chloroflexota bacterium]|nr:PASTA domain-containing protein [Chloroflexota bacterium]